ncbi:MAG: hypothetical protein PHH85_01080 [Candidatus Methanoperedens sp.]|nr:hypothetical protein [Candidatus Methanoperedens sp.]
MGESIKIPAQCSIGGLPCRGRASIRKCLRLFVCAGVGGRGTERGSDGYARIFSFFLFHLLPQYLPNLLLNFPISFLFASTNHKNAAHVIPMQPMSIKIPRRRPPLLSRMGESRMGRGWDLHRLARGR